MNFARLASLFLAAFLLIPSLASAKTPRYCTLAKSYSYKVKSLRVRVKRSMQNFDNLWKQFKTLDARAKAEQRKVIVYFRKVFNSGSSSVKYTTWKYYQRHFRRLRFKVSAFKKTGISPTKIPSSGYKFSSLFSSFSKYGSKFKTSKFKIPSSYKNNFGSKHLKQIYQAYLMRQYLTTLRNARTLSKAASVKGKQALRAGAYAKRYLRVLKFYVHRLKAYNRACLRDLLRNKKLFRIIRWKRTALDMDSQWKRCGVDEDALLSGDDCTAGACTSTVDMSGSESEASAGGDVVSFGNQIGFEGNFQTVFGAVANHDSFDAAAVEADTTASTF
jgi:hypothetical protein